MRETFSPCGPHPNPPPRSGGGNKESLAQTVFALYFVLLQSADARERASAVGDRNCDHDFVRARRIGDACLDRIEVAAHERRILVAERYIDRRSWSAHLLGRGNQC